ncbi:MAG: domain S-box-containing protein [Proteobacteria bacterium]|nr:domain S-box-containing protein [Pseudomonadota bacterium]
MLGRQGSSRVHARPRWARLVPIYVAGAIGLVTLAFLVSHAVSELRRMIESPDDNLQWATFQVQNEFNRLQVSLADLDAGTWTTIEEVQKRFDIFYSRIDLIRSAPTFAELRAEPDIAPLIGKLSEFVEKSNPIIHSKDKLSEEKIRSYRIYLDTLQDDMYEFVLKSLHFFSNRTDVRRDDLKIVLEYIAFWASALLLSLALAIFLLIRQRGELVARENELRESEHSLAEAQRIAGLGSFSRDLVTDEAVYSDEYRRIFGIPQGGPARREEVLERIHPEDRNTTHFALDELARNGKVSDFIEQTFRVATPDGQWRWVHGLAELRGTENGKAVKMVGTVHDITSEREIQSALIAAKNAAEEATHAKSEFLAIMSHEIRTPMNGILGMLSVLDDTSLTDDQRKLVSVAKASADSLLVLLNDILDMSKIEAGKMEFELSTFELLPLVRSVIHLYSPQARSKGLVLDSVVDEEAPSVVIGDAGRIRQVLLNLVSNALKFTTHGTVIVRLCAPRSLGMTVRFEVTDTGVGIAEDKHTAVFVSFNQIDHSYARRFGGTGLGLSICRSLIEAMKGEIGFDSVAGSGSTFWFELPLQISQAPIRKEAREEGIHQPAAALRILVAEDNTTNQMVARMLLEGLGHKVDVVNDGLEAVEAIKRRAYDLILMDISMPVMDGIEASHRIREMGGPYGSIPIVALTANAMAADREICLRAGINRVMTKPIVKAKLEALLSEIQQVDWETAEVIPEVLNADTLQQLSLDLGVEGTAQLLRAAAEDFNRLEADARQALELSDGLRLRRAFHAMRGVAGNIGAVELQEATSKGEDALLKDDGAALSSLWSTVERPLANARNELERIEKQSQTE